ncbi:MAG TPA: electron transport complex subunit RsxG [Proteus sp.]|uniref:Ion-translocating oxidoreductase complex subunit G n=1 Tax=Proteus hauseri ATCC 700826 TaxID=1354271 RepID=A0AAJ3LTQ1_PROHU|nr:electron transport complex subunit RsxG [Proteus hauseri]OAT46865.1 RnfG family electron transport complex protein [Proteus hauseri ATCC 700826]QAV24556.1 electron transport complex subunit RsxG [Proteus hauseri]HCH51002.1 electron transport complex subunit RsxG [Proteus sp. (in: enterobacteria)]
MIDILKRHGLTLAIFAACTTGLTAVVYHLTADTIAEQAALEKQKLLDQVIPQSIYNNNLSNDCYILTNKALGNDKPHKLYVARLDGKPVAAALESTAPDGYSGAIELLVGADFQGKVLGVRVTTHNETPGLGDKIETRISDWINSLSNRFISGESDPRWAVKKDGGDFDQFTGATITPRAVVNASKRTAWLMQSLPEQIATLPVCEEQ